MRYTIWPNEADQRFDRFVRKVMKKYPEVTLKDIYLWIRRWNIKVNDRRVDENYRLRKGDIVSLHHMEALTNMLHQPLDFTITKLDKTTTFPIEQLRPMIIHEDDHWIVWNKPPHILIHPGHKHHTDLTMNDYLVRRLKYHDNYGESDTFKPSFCYRLDKDTSGILIGAKTYDALKHLNNLIQTRQDIEKSYLVIVAGHITTTTRIDTPLFKWFDATRGVAKTFVNEEKWLESLTIVHPLHHRVDPVLGPLTLLQAHIYTGRMHQIRVHLASIGHVVIGDELYGEGALNYHLYHHYQINRQLLHSRNYRFIGLEWLSHQFSAPVPMDFIRLAHSYDFSQATTS